MFGPRPLDFSGVRFATIVVRELVLSEYATLCLSANNDLCSLGWARQSHLMLSDRVQLREQERNQTPSDFTVKAKFGAERKDKEAP